MNKIALTEENYYSTEASRYYLSNSLLSNYIECPARGNAIRFGAWKMKQSEAMKIGSLFHLWCEDKDKYLEELEKPEYHVKTGKKSLLAKFSVVPRMIKAIEAEPLMMKYLVGEKEKIVTGIIGGIDFKGKLDVISDTYYTDLKSARDLNEDFYNHFDYIRQFAIYDNLIQQQYNKRLDCFIVACSKESPCNKRVIKVKRETLDAKFEEVLAHNKLIKPYWDKPSKFLPRCECCSYCITTKELDFFEEI